MARPARRNPEYSIDHETVVIKDLGDIIETIADDRFALERVLAFLGSRYDFQVQVFD
jgi:hypothetical protein